MANNNRTPVQVSFDRVSVWIKKQAKGIADMKEMRQQPKDSQYRQVLHDLQGVFRPGRLSVILGGSGAGKSVLLGILAGNGAQMQRARVEGNVYANQELLPQGHFMSQLAGFVQQDDLLPGYMRVEECLMMSALLRRPELTQGQREQAVTKALNVLPLSHIRHSQVGSVDKRGVSGGERKRVSIAMEILADPSVLYLDEPTSGLDTFSALLTVKLLKRLANQGRTIVSTLHVPSPQMVDLIDDFMILANGRIIFHGPAEYLQRYFVDIGYQFSAKINPVDQVFLGIMRREEDVTSEAGSSDRIQSLAYRYSRSQMLTYQRTFQTHPPLGLIMPQMLKRQSSTMVQTRWLFNREFMRIGRNPDYVITRFVSTIGLAVFVALVFLNIGRNTTGSPFGIYQSIEGVLFLLIINQLFTSFNAVLFVFGEEKPQFQREFSSGYYKVNPYFLSKLFIELPFQIIFPVLVSFIVYWIIGLQGGFDRFLIFLLLLTLTSLFGAALGLAVGSNFKSTENATIIGPLFILPLVIYGGFFVNLNESPPWLSWIQWVSPAQYAFTGMALNDLSPRSIQGVTGTSQLDSLGITSRLGVGIDIVLLCVLIVATIALAWYGLRRSVSKAGIRLKDVLRKRQEVLERGA